MAQNTAYIFWNNHQKKSWKGVHHVSKKARRFQFRSLAPENSHHPSIHLPATSECGETEEEDQSRFEIQIVNVSSGKKQKHPGVREFSPKYNFRKETRKQILVWRRRGGGRKIDFGDAGISTFLSIRHGDFLRALKNAEKVPEKRGWWRQRLKWNWKVMPPWRKERNAALRTKNAPKTLSWMWQMRFSWNLPRFRFVCFRYNTMYCTPYGTCTCMNFLLCCEKTKAINSKPTVHVI